MQIADEEIILKNIDQELIDTARVINLQKFLTPVNLQEEGKIFVQKDGNYDPQFAYKFPEEEDIFGVIKKLEALEKRYFDSNTYTHPMAKLLEDKLKEDINKAYLLIAYIRQDRDQANHYNKILFGDFDKTLLKKAEDIIWNYQKPDLKIRWPRLNNDEVLVYIKDYIKKKSIDNIKINHILFWNTPLMISFSKSVCYLTVPKNLVIREYDLMASLVHEIEVHHTRYVNGKKSWWNILAHGTANYSKDEEGLAVYESRKYRRSIYPDFEQKGIYEKYILLENGDGKSFQEMKEIALSLKIAKSNVTIFNIISRLKWGVKDTSTNTKWNNFIKSKIYLDWVDALEKRIINGWCEDDLFKWKVKIEDLPYLEW